MTPKTRWLVGTAGLIVAIASYSLFLRGASPTQQGQASLQITSPADGTVVAPGQTIKVAVSTSPGARFALISVTGQLGSATRISGSEFPVDIPKTISLGKYAIGAMGILTTGQNIFAQNITLDVESASPITSLTANPDTIFFQFAGQQFSIRVTGSFSDGTGSDITESSRISFSSDDATVAVIDQHGSVTAVGSGKTNVVAHYGDKVVDIPVSVPKTIRGDLNGDGKVDQDDVNIILSAWFGFETSSGTPATSIPATKPFDARDLNGDGRIDLQDANIVASLCTSQCAGINVPPDIGGARPSSAILWPPDHRMVPVSILGVSDPHGQITIRVDAIRQDEPTNGLGGGDTCPDGQGVGTSTAQLRAERSGSGQGRVYTIFFTAENSRLGRSQGTVQVCVPHDQGRGSTCAFTGFHSKPARDSTICAP